MHLVTDDRLLNTLQVAVILHHGTYEKEEAWRKALSAPNDITLEDLTAPLTEFGVWRWLPEATRKKLPEFLKKWRRTGPFVGNPAAQIESAVRELSEETTSTAWPSGMTKAFWFIGLHNRPMFDRFTSAAFQSLCGKDRTEIMKSFYNKIEVTGYEVAHKKCEDVIKDVQENWAIPERILDKALMVTGARRRVEKLLTKDFGRIVFVPDQAKFPATSKSDDPARNKKLAELADELAAKLRDKICAGFP